ncbi:MAG: tetratricopeptide repeat protein [Chloroflexi bacterium]|nr:tetratricopeptide repeat protein [Chloroflexota bacterium]
MSNLIVTKTYQGDKTRLFLHDELYDLFDRYFLGDPRYRPEFFKPLKDYYQKNLDLAYQKYLDTDSQEKLSTHEIEDIKLALLYYALQCEHDVAYVRYYVRWDEEAIKKHETGFDMRLRDEVLRFYNRYAFDEQSPFYDSGVATRVDAKRIHRDCAVRWVKRHLARGDFQLAHKAAQNVYHSQDYLFNWVTADDPIYKAGLLTAWSEALLYIVNTDEQFVLDKLNEVFTLLPNGHQSGEMTSDDVDDDIWLEQQILGKAYNNRGYFHRYHGRYGQAYDDYRHALGYFRQIDLADERANTLTNLAYLLALMGEADTAIYQIEQAIEIRERLDQSKRYTIALSRNTRGLIYAMKGDFEVGIQECQQALAICEDIGELRGIGLACLALGFSLRRRGEQWKRGALISTKTRAVSDFAQAKAYLERAITVFSNPKDESLHSWTDKANRTWVNEPIRLWEGLNELGSLYCDRAYLALNIEENESVLSDYYNQAIAAQEKSLDIAVSKGLKFQTTDSYDDLAQVYHDYARLLKRMGKEEEAGQFFKKAEKHLLKIENHLVPAEFQFMKHQPAKKTRSLPQSGLTYWQSLGKLYLQRSEWEAKKLEYREVTFGLERFASMELLVRYQALSFAYFQRYGPQSAHLSKMLSTFTKRLDSLKVPPELARETVGQVEAETGFNLRRLINTIDNTLGM